MATATITVRLKENATTRATWTLDTDTAWTTDSLPLSASEAAAIHDWSALVLEFDATATGGARAEISWASFATQSDVPTRELAATLGTGWTSTADLQVAKPLAADLTGALSLSADLTAPGPPTGSVVARLLEDDNARATWALTSSSEWDTISLTLSAAEAAAITDWSALSLELYATATGGARVEISWVQLAVDPAAPSGAVLAATLTAGISGGATLSVPKPLSADLAWTIVRSTLLSVPKPLHASLVTSWAVSADLTALSAAPSQGMVRLTAGRGPAFAFYAGPGRAVRLTPREPLP